MGLPVEYILIVALIIIARSLVFALKSMYISLIRTKEYAIAEISGYLTRLPVGIILVTIGLGGIGAALGYFIAFPITSMILFILYIKLIGRISLPSFKELKIKGSEIFKAGMANWPTTILLTMGPQLGVIMVYGYQGASEAGLYYIAQAIMFVVFSIPLSVMAIMFPLLSGMKDERKRTMWRVIRVSLAISTPIIVLGCLYPRIVLGMLGPEYLVADLILIVLLMNIIPDTIAFGVSNLAYAYGNYRQVLSIGLARSLPRMILYLFLTPLYGGLGAAESFLVGSVTALIVAYVVAYRLKFKINWMEIALIILVPALLGILIYLTELFWILGLILILIISFFIYAKLRLITKDDLKQITKAFLPQKLVKIGIRRFSWVLKMLYGD
jgi:O-antigen/teichoic acid export membrane protein